jgi:broad specificity phosphatase PhoE
MAIEIVYETHSTTLDNERGLATGWNHGELSITGRKQAEELGLRHADRSVDAVYSSDLGRASETAQIAFADRGVEIHQDQGLRECNYGEWNGAPVDQIHRDRKRFIEERHLGGESYLDVVHRVRDFLDHLAASGVGSVVLISHRAPWYAMEHLLNGVPLEDVVVAPFEWQPGWRYTLTG